MKADDIREWDDTEIDARLKELKQEQFKMRFTSSMMELENPSLPGQIKRDIARLKTVRRERQLAENA
jgi:large subunit ribosomal protein L29